MDTRKNVTDLQQKINFPYFPSQLVLCGWNGGAG